MSQSLKLHIAKVFLHVEVLNFMLLKPLEVNGN